MSKHVVFQPVDLSKNDDQIKETILWAAKFNLHPKIESDLPPAIVDIVKKQSDIRYPLAYWEKEFENLWYQFRLEHPNSVGVLSDQHQSFSWLFNKMKNRLTYGKTLK